MRSIGGKKLRNVIVRPIDRLTCLAGAFRVGLPPTFTLGFFGPKIGTLPGDFIWIAWASEGCSVFEHVRGAGERSRWVMAGRFGVMRLRFVFNSMASELIGVSVASSRSTLLFACAVRLGVVGALALRRVGGEL